MKYIIILVATLIIGCYGTESKKTGFEGKQMPSFELLMADSITYFDTKYISNKKPTVFFLFLPNCPFCRAQMDEIINDIDILKEIQLYIFTARPFSEMKNFYDHYKLNKYPNIVVGFDYKNFFGNYFKVSSVPYIAVYGKDKNLNEVFIGKTECKIIKKATQI